MSVTHAPRMFGLLPLATARQRLSSDADGIGKGSVDDEAWFLPQCRL